ncbi:MAG: hypothetical protein QM564_03360 [Bergeyella sp.]
MMKNFAIIVLLAFPLFFNAQLKNTVRKIDIKITGTHALRIENSGEGDKTEDMSKVELPDGDETGNSVTIANPYDTPVRFAFSTADIMEVAEVAPHSFWSGESNDYWQNFVIETNGKQQAYSLKTNNCFAIFWDKKAKVWSIKGMKCKMYQN